MIRPDYKSGKSLHEQIEDEMKRLIISGAVRELAFLGEDKDAVKELIDQIYREKEENK